MNERIFAAILFAACAAAGPASAQAINPAGVGESAAQGGITGATHPSRNANPVAGATTGAGQGAAAGAAQGAAQGGAAGGASSAASGAAARGAQTDER